MNKNNTPQEIWQAMLAAKNPILCIDSRFDYDAFGSALALQQVLQSKGIKLRLTYASDIPEYALDYLPNEGGGIGNPKVEIELEPSKVDFSSHDLLITADSANFAHISKKGEFEKPSNIKIIKIDHHETSLPEGDLNYVRVTSSTCRLVWELLTKNEEKINAEVGYLLALGHLTDTGFLKYESVDSEDFRMIADLVDKGVNISDISWKLGFNNTVENTKFCKVVYENLVIDEKNGYAYSSLTKENLQDINMGNVYLKGADLIKTLRNIEFAFVVKESFEVQDAYDVSFRSRLPDMDVSKFAAALDGGGHKMAAAGIVKDVKNIQEAINKVKKMIKNHR